MKMPPKTVFSHLLVCLVVGLSALDARAFSLLGPYESWMTLSNGFFPLPSDIGGPLNIGEEYRWNVPVVTYAFDQSFLNYFGSNGVAAVESAIQILNDLPPASQVDPSTYLLDTRRENVTTQTVELIDLKSETLFLLLQQLGLAQPQRFMFCVHDFSVSSGHTNVTIVQRHFDPFSFVATNVLNGTLFTSILTFNINDPVFADTVTVGANPVDPFAPAFTAVAEGWSGKAGGSFYAGLTRDDVGGLRYLLRTNNYHFETLLPDVHGAGVNPSNYVNLAMRGGVDKITFVRKPVDPITGELFLPFTNQYTDTYVTNNILMQQQLERVTYRPDIIFSAFDDAEAFPPPVESTGTTNWLNNAALNGNPDQAGPGVIRPQVTIAFLKWGLFDFLWTSDSDAPILSFARWGSFDASTNPPVVYPTQPPAGAGNPWTVRLSLLDTNDLPLAGGYFTWQMPVPLGKSATLESSTNLTSWTPLTTVTNYGIPVYWEHFYSRPAGFFRAVPQ